MGPLKRIAEDIAEQNHARGEPPEMLDAPDWPTAIDKWLKTVFQLFITKNGEADTGEKLMNFESKILTVRGREIRNQLIQEHLLDNENFKACFKADKRDWNLERLVTRFSKMKKTWKSKGRLHNRARGLGRTPRSRARRNDHSDDDENDDNADSHPDSIYQSESEDLLGNGGGTFRPIASSIESNIPQSVRPSVEANFSNREPRETPFSGPATTSTPTLPLLQDSSSSTERRANFELTFLDGTVPRFASFFALDPSSSQTTLREFWRVILSKAANRHIRVNQQASPVVHFKGEQGSRVQCSLEDDDDFRGFLKEYCQNTGETFRVSVQMIT